MGSYYVTSYNIDPFTGKPTKQRRLVGYLPTAAGKGLKRVVKKA